MEPLGGPLLGIFSDCRRNMIRPKSHIGPSALSKRGGLPSSTEMRVRRRQPALFSSYLDQSEPNSNHVNRKKHEGFG